MNAPATKSLFIVRILKLILSLLFGGVCQCVEVAAHLLGVRFHPRWVVLLYHTVTERQRNYFCKQMDYLARRAERTLPAPYHGLKIGINPITITFDDGLESVVRNALPELSKREIPCIFFVPTGYMGAVAGWKKWHDRDTLPDSVVNETQLPNLVNDLVTIGSHSVTHRILRNLSNEEVREELVLSKRVLENITRKDVDCFSFPYGEYDGRTLELARQLGYKHVFRDLPTLFHSDPTSLLVGRINASPDDWMIEFQLKVSGYYRWTAALGLLKRKLSDLCAKHGMSLLSGTLNQPRGQTRHAGFMKTDLEDTVGGHPDQDNPIPGVAYVAMQFPSLIESYVVNEITALRKSGVRVTPFSIRKPLKEELGHDESMFLEEALTLWPIKISVFLSAVPLLLLSITKLKDVYARVIFRGREGPWRRMKALAHILVGACFAVIVRDRAIVHIHAHHGYFASWAAMVAARILGISYSMTLHGSDLLLHQAYMDLKLAHCKFCVTISEYNRHFILKNFPETNPEKIYVNRLGVDPPSASHEIDLPATPGQGMVILTVGRLEAVKNHRFLIQACAELKKIGFTFACLIVGGGSEYKKLEKLILELDLSQEVRLLGTVDHKQVRSYYEMADLVVLTSHSEGIPLVLMEAMSMGKPVLAPAITGIPELVIDGETGFLYTAGQMDEFVTKIQLISQRLYSLKTLEDQARRHLELHFSRSQRLANFCEIMMQQVACLQEHPHK